MQGYPTIKVFGEDKDSPSDYQGGRDGSSLTAFVMAQWKKTQPPPEVLIRHVYNKMSLEDSQTPFKRTASVPSNPVLLEGAHQVSSFIGMTFKWQASQMP